VEPLSLMLGQVQQLKVKVVLQERMRDGEYSTAPILKLQEVHIFQQLLFYLYTTAQEVL
jgi:hypothetical protein